MAHRVLVLETIIFIYFVFWNLKNWSDDRFYFFKNDGGVGKVFTLRGYPIDEINSHVVFFANEGFFFSIYHDCDSLSLEIF